jgi:DNA-binding NarL/FixJ family response regulator
LNLTLLRRILDTAPCAEDCMTSIRVLVANRPRLLREMVIATISDQPDIEIVGEIQDESAIGSAVELTRPDFLIVALERHNRLPGFCKSILEDHPRIKIIAIAPDRNSTIFCSASFRVRSNQIEASETGVLNALRGITQPARRLQ